MTEGVEVKAEELTKVNSSGPVVGAGQPTEHARCTGGACSHGTRPCDRGGRVQGETRRRGNRYPTCSDRPAQIPVLWVYNME